MKPNHFLAICVVLVTLAVVLACSPAAPPGASVTPTRLAAPEKPSLGAWEQLVADARKEGTVTYYFEGSPEARTGITEVMLKEYGIRVEFVVGKGDQIVAKLKQERQAGLYWADVITVGTTSAETLRQAGAVVVLDPYVVLPDALDPRAWPDGRPKFLDGQHTLAGLAYYYMPFILTNTDLVKDNEIASHLDLLNPRWKGKITLYDPTLAGTGPYWVAYLMRAMGEAWTDKFFKELVKQDITVTRDSRLQAESVVRGKFPIAIAYSMSASGQFLKMGAPIRPTSTVEGGQVSSGAASVSLADRAPHPRAAALVLNWLMGREGSALFAEAAGYLPFRQDITASWIHPLLVPPKGGKLIMADEEYLNYVSEHGREIAQKYFGAIVK